MSDVVADLLVANDISHVFMVTGGGAMHLNDAFGKHPGLSPVFCHHEQACAMAAESYGRLTNRLAAVNVTTGPGGLNSLNGVFGAFVDSIGMVVISGQVKLETMMGSYKVPLRQLGDQEVDIASIANGITKSSEVLDNPLDVRYVVERAIWIARNGRKGPVWIDIPVDVQAALVAESQLRVFDPLDFEENRIGDGSPLTGEALSGQLHRMLTRLSAAQRPVVLAGTGVRLSGCYETFLRVVEKLGVPVATAFNAHDLLEEAHPLYVGRPGTVGDRAGNFAVQNADFLLVLGCRLNIRQISYNWPAFARDAYKVMVDIDLAEIAKPTLHIDLPIHADLSEVLILMDKDLAYRSEPSHQEYLRWCQVRRAKYPVMEEAYEGTSSLVDPYCFVSRLFEELDDDDVVVCGDGTACVVTFQTAKIRSGQRLYSNSGSASMGYDLPAAVGAAVARGGKRVICIAGDGSIMMNIQELQTIAGYQFPIKIFVLNNDGYSSIRQTQNNYFPGGLVGCDPASGVTFPDFVKVGNAFGITSRRCESLDAAPKDIRNTLDGFGPQLLEVMLDRDRPFTPKLASRQLPNGRMVSAPLEDLSPFLSREELAQNLLIPAMPDE